MLQLFNAYKNGEVEDIIANGNFRLGRGRRRGGVNTFGKNIRLSIFGESHGAGVGIVIDGLPAGRKIDFAAVKKEMSRRAPGGELSTKRKEDDEFEILSGVKDGATNGYPLACLIRNKDANPLDYDEEIFRPSHADYPAYIKYGAALDISGGGHFSGRLTAPLVFAGAIAKQFLPQGSQGPQGPQGPKEIKISSEEVAPNPERAREASREGDSVGGVARVRIKNVPAGFGEPFFNSVESEIAALAFSVPAVKGISFGAGADFAKLKGSEANDEMRASSGEVSFLSNNNGGILGGLTTGEDIVFDVIIKPTASIAKKQKTVKRSGAGFKNAEIKIAGRHDAYILPRALPVLEAIAAIAILDLLNERSNP